MFPIFALKTVKMTLESVKPFLDDSNLNLKIIHLVRDPRAVRNARNQVLWCNRDCANIVLHCKKTRDDLRYGDKLMDIMPEKYIRIKYEDLLKSFQKVFFNILFTIIINVQLLSLNMTHFMM